MRKNVDINREYRIIRIYTQKKETDSHELAFCVGFAVHFDGGERRPGMLHYLTGHILSFYGLLIAQELHLLVPLLMTVF